MQRLPSRMEILFYHTCPFRPREVQRGELRLGGLPGGIGIKVGKMIRSRRKPGQCLSARNHKRNHYQRRLSMPSSTVRHHAPVMGGEWMIGKFATVSALTHSQSRTFKSSILL